MAYQVLARKYRPQRFDEVIGQEHVTRTLKNALEQQRIAHGYIFSGHRGIGKTTVARILAMALNCRAGEKPQAEPCGKCDSCNEIRASGSVDVIEIDAATNRGIDEIRELRDAARYRPARDRYKIYILDEAHQITDAAFNALLKTLEEPPAHVIFMMATTQPEDIPQTIRSRCQHFNFHAVRFNQIVEQLREITNQEKLKVEEDALALVAEAGDGSLRDALSILDQAIASSSGHVTASIVRDMAGAVPSEILEKILRAVAANSSEEVLRTVDRLCVEGQSVVHFARQMVRFLRNALVAKVAGGESELLQISADERVRVCAVAELFSEEELTRFLQIMLRGYNDISYRADQRFHLELTLLKLVHAQRLLPVEQALSGIMGIEPQAKAAPALPNTAAAGARDSASNLSVREPAQASPFERDRARKSNTPPEQSSAAAAVMVAPEKGLDSNHAAAAESNVDIQAIRQSVLLALQKGGHQMLASQLEPGNWKLAGNELVVSSPAAVSLLEMGFTAEAKRVTNAAATSAAGRTLKLRLESDAATANSSASPARAMQPSAPSATGNANNGRRRAAEDPLVQRVQEKFSAEIRTVIDYREKER